MTLQKQEQTQKCIQHVQEALHGEELMSSPLASASEGLNNGKPKRKPTVTPRTFTRFFTPRASLGKRRKGTSSRQALRDITSPAINRSANSSSGVLWTLGPFPDIKVSEHDDAWSGGLRGTEKRRMLAHPNSTTDRSSPVTNLGEWPLEMRDAKHDDCDRATRTDNEADPEDSRNESNEHVKTNPRLRQRIWYGSSGRILERSLRGSAQFRSLGQVDHCGYWQDQTANFYSRPEDSHLCTNASSQDRALPFCTASCNSRAPLFRWITELVLKRTIVANSLVAIGDEEGGVRLLESAKDGGPSFSTAYLTFRPHSNAILDLAFSSNDMLLATASGDQSARIIDMPTQRTTFTMAGHVSSVKQVRFQPGSNDNVIASSSRDGSVQIWDLRCKGFDASVRDIHVSLDRSSTEPEVSKDVMLQRMTWARSVNNIYAAHAFREPKATPTPISLGGTAIDAPSKTEPPGRQGDVSVTALAFLQPGREHLLLTTSEANTSVKLWDLRTTHNHRRRGATPLSTTRQPQSHDRHRQFGLTSLSLSGDGARFYTLCRDNTVYAYSTSHLILGHAPELSSAPSRPRRSGGLDREGLGPIYGFRHPQFHATTFYVKSSMRRGCDDKSEMLSVGSSDGCVVLFPTDERYMKRQYRTSTATPIRRLPERPSVFPRTTRPSLSRTSSGVGLSTRMEDAIPIYQHGTALVRGHSKEVTASAWTCEGNLVTVGDDFVARCWREGPDARDLRIGGEKDGRRWGCGWADIEGDWDEDD
ncbi:MAG: hypothetical protein M1830_004876 [Pleopsidium flavum]|nr:MAG: hypothetical protein M1830_004876 [Pleopsidium flavum]